MLTGLEYLNSLAQWKGKGGFGLEKMQLICGRLGNPQNKPKLIHVGGTNGKGSTSAAIAAAISHAGYSVGLNISPHLYSLNERISINGKCLEDSELDELLLRVKRAADNADIAPSFHEAITIAAFLAFENLDYAVLEVGLGGRLDASNVIRAPEVAVITSIGYDHQDILGPTLVDIAREKAEIIKSGSRVVLGSFNPEVEKVFIDKCLSANLRDFKILGKDFFCENINSEFNFEDANCKFSFNSKLFGAHQSSNLGIASEVLLNLEIPIESIQKGFNSLRWPARLEEFQLGSYATGFLDCSHNEDGSLSLISFLDSQNIKEIDLVFAALQTKNWHNMLNLLSKYIRKAYLLTAKSEMAVPSSELTSQLSSFGINCENFGSDYKALVEKLSVLDDKNMFVPLIITGSIYMVGELRESLLGQIETYW